MKQKSKVKMAIVLLSVLLVLSLLALGGTLVYRVARDSHSVTVSVPENMIHSDSNSEISLESDLPDDAAGGFGSTTSTENAETKNSGQKSPIHKNTSAYVKSDTSKSREKAVVISLYQNHEGDNQPFQVGNMFPGDAETKYYCVKISHNGTVTVNYRADIRSGYEKLAEVLKCRIVLLTTGETLYNGLMRDMPESIEHSVKAGKGNQSELYYGITAYLDTSVGNDYQNRDLIADFCWWVNNTESGGSADSVSASGTLMPPGTGDAASLWLYAAAASGSLLLILFLCKKCRKGEEA